MGINTQRDSKVTEHLHVLNRLHHLVPPSLSFP